MTGAFERLGIDYVQWKAVTRTLLRTDFRLPLTTDRAVVGRVGSWLMMVVFLGLFGLGPAIVVASNPDIVLTGIITLTYLSVMLMTTLLTQHGTTMLSTADYAVLGPRPVSSRTFLAIRVTNVLFHAWLTTTLMAYPAIVAYGLAHGSSAARAAAAALAIYLWSTVLTLLLVTGYGAVLHLAGAARLRRMVGYLQVVGGILAYGGLLLSNRLFGRSSFATVTMPDAWWLLLVPPAWYTSYLEIATAVVNSTTWIRAALSVAVIAAVLTALRGKLALEYAGRLADLASLAERPGSAAVRTPLFPRAEGRAIAILVLAHFRHDLRVRMGILAIVPLMALYLFVGTRGRSFDLVAIAVLMFPALLSQHFASTDSYQAAWLYRAAPVDPGQLVVALKNVAVTYFLLPFLVFVLGVFTWRFGDVGRAAVHTAILGLISHLALQGSTLLTPRLPFSLPPDKTRGHAALFGWMLFIILGGQAVLFGLDRWVYWSPPRIAAVVALLIAVSVACNRLIAVRARAIPN